MREPGDPGGMEPGEALDACDRYARVLSAQLETLRTGEPDLDRFHELAGERERIAEEIESTGPSAVPPAHRPTLAARLKQLHVLDRQVLDRLRELRLATVDALRGMQDRAPDRESYLATSRARTEPPHFDIRF